MADKTSPSIDQFAEVLSEESDWYTLGIFLGAPTQELDTIGLNYRAVSIMRCLIELYKCLKTRGKTPSWDFVAGSLRRMNNHSLADKIDSFRNALPLKPSSSSGCSAEPSKSSPNNKTMSRKTASIDVPHEILKQFVSLTRKFAKLILNIKNEFVQAEVNIVDLQNFINRHCGLTPFSGREATFEAVFHRFEEECSIFNSYILNFVIDLFLPKNQMLTEEMEEFEKALDSFKSSAKMAQLVDLIEKRETNSSSDRQLVSLKVREFWGHPTIKQFETAMNELLGILYGHLSHMSVAKGCYCISWTIGNIDIVTASKLVPKHSMEFMKIVGVISLQIGKEMLYDLNREIPLGCEILEAAMLQAIELKNTQAIELLLTIGCSPEAATYNEDTNVVDIRMKPSFSSSGGGVVDLVASPKGTDDDKFFAVSNSASASEFVARKLQLLETNLMDRSWSNHVQYIPCLKQYAML